MAERIYNRGGDGGLEPLQEQPFAAEDDLQALIAKHPALLDGEQMRPGNPLRWLLITREMGIAESHDLVPRWSVDLLLVDQDAVPTLVEVKRGSNPEIRRTIVGQLLEYAAYASQTWTADELRNTFERLAQTREVDPGEELAILLQSEGEADAEVFWQNVATNFVAKHLRLLFVADEIPDPLERVVEFLNAQMHNIEVLAVEIKQFRGESSQTLVPRVLGRTAALVANGASASRRKLTRETFLEEVEGEEYKNVVDRLIDKAREHGGFPDWGSSSVSIRIRCVAWQQPVTVAWIFPPEVSGWMGFRNITFGAAIFSYDPPPGEELRETLDRWVALFSGDDFAKDVSRSGTKAWEVDYANTVQNIEMLEARLASVLSELGSL